MSPEASTRYPGLLVAVVGPSGAGKDTLLRLALERLGDEQTICLARRVVTRPTDGQSEDHLSLDEAGFARAEAAGEFSLTWRAHGLAYGLPRSIEDRLRERTLVLANLSRRVLGEAALTFGRLAVVEVTAPPEVLLERIAARGREPKEMIAKRLARQAPLVIPEAACGVLRIENSGPAEEGAMILCAHLRMLQEHFR